MTTRFTPSLRPQLAALRLVVVLTLGCNPFGDNSTTEIGVLTV